MVTRKTDFSLATENMPETFEKRWKNSLGSGESGLGGKFTQFTVRIKMALSFYLTRDIHEEYLMT
jgi:tartrate dehydratase alpha subunit/fumarate hydratase class I-like protein